MIDTVTLPVPHLMPGNQVVGNVSADTGVDDLATVMSARAVLIEQDLRVNLDSYHLPTWTQELVFTVLAVQEQPGGVYVDVTLGAVTRAYDGTWQHSITTLHVTAERNVDVVRMGL